MNKRSGPEPETILVIDDDEVSLAVISMLLEAEDFTVSQASSGEKAIWMVQNLAREERPQIVLADLQMPGICGPELATALRRYLPGVPLLAMSATTGDTEGYNGFIRKPLEAGQVRSALQQGTISQPEPPPAVKDEGILDEVVYTRLSGMMPQRSLDEIYQACLDDVRARAEKMEAAAATDDQAEIRRHAHAVKGSAGMVGARNLAAAAADLEAGGFRQDDIASKIDNLLFCCNELQRILLDRHP
ncbi:Hpt domain-containing response regulator [Silvibacterium acidisoli]|uniref:Hpt domain-containing response regulator n=1 Tax=Acidobacteriaceae bacterium ZG23-2 TaxID=2883246 RepID=UPI00406CE2C7